MSNLTSAIPNRVRQLRAERGWSLSELAERAGTSAPQIMRIERSQRQLTLQWIERLAAAFEMSASELAFETPRIDVVSIPVVGRIQAGNWQEAVEMADVRIDIPSTLAPSFSAFGLRVQGNSMDLLIPEGGIVIINPDDADLLDGKTYAIMNEDGETTVKRYRASPARFEPVSSDPSHKIINIGRAPFTVIGRVRGVMMEM